MALFTDTVTILSGCKKCDYQWNDYIFTCPSYDDGLTKLAQEAYPSLDGVLSIELNKLSLVCGAMVKMARPYDRIWQSLKRIPFIEKHFELAEQAYLYLEDKDFFGGLQLIRGQIHQADKCKESQGSIVSLQLKDQFKERAEYVGKARSILVESSTSLALREHVNYEQLAKALRVPKSEMFKIIQIAEFPQENGTSITQDRIFDLEKVKQYLSRFRGFEDVRNIGIEVNDHRLPAHLTSYAQMIIDILTGNLKGSFSSTSLASVSVHPQEFESWLKGQLNEACLSPVDINKVAYLMGNSNDDVRLLIRKGELHYAPWDRYLNMVDGQSLRSFLEMNSV